MGLAACSTARLKSPGAADLTDRTVEILRRLAGSNNTSRAGAKHAQSLVHAVGQWNLRKRRIARLRRRRRVKLRDNAMVVFE
jgi:hypothetical protein